METFSLFLTTGIFLDKMKIAKDSQVHKSVKIYLVKSPTNFRSFLLFKKLEWIICNRIVNLIVLFNKQFGFWLFWLFNKICTNKVSWSYVALFLGVSIDHHGLNRIDLDTKRLKTKIINDNNYKTTVIIMIKSALFKYLDNVQCGMNLVNFKADGLLWILAGVRKKMLVVVK